MFGRDKMKVTTGKGIRKTKAGRVKASETTEISEYTWNFGTSRFGPIASPDCCFQRPSSDLYQQRPEVNCVWTGAS